MSTNHGKITNMMQALRRIIHPHSKHSSSSPDLVPSDVTERAHGVGIVMVRPLAAKRFRRRTNKEFHVEKSFLTLGSQTDLRWKQYL